MDPGDPLSPAIEAVTGRFALLVRSIGSRHGLGDEDLDELMQAVRLRLWRARQSSEQIEATPASYVYRTAVTASLDLIRARRTQRAEAMDSLREGDETMSSVRPDAQSELEARELAALVGQSVERVTPSRRPVLRMYLAGYDRREIADLMGWSEAKTRNLLYRGLADLRSLLEAQGLGPEMTR